MFGDIERKVCVYAANLHFKKVYKKMCFKKKPFKHVKSYSQAFTLLEVLIIAIIIVITASIVIPYHRKTVQRARLKEAEAQLEMIYDAEIQYHTQRDEYTDEFDELGLYLESSRHFSYNISAASDTFTATATYEGCTLTIDQSDREVDRNGCSF